MKRWFVLGASGQLGRSFCERLRARGDDVLALDVPEFDLLDLRGLPELHGAAGVINCAAFTNVDGAEEREELATRINGTAVGELGELCRRAKLPLVHFSTDYVFDGRATEPYAPDHPRSPVNAYGRSKALGEQLLEQSGAEHLLIRTSWVYAAHGNNFVLTMKRLMSERTHLSVVDDQRGRPTHVDELSGAALELLERGERGTFHRTDSGECSWFEFAQAIAETIGSSCRIDPCTTAEFPRPAVRPAYSVLDTSGSDALLGPAPHFRERLERTLRGSVASGGEAGSASEHR